MITQADFRAALTDPEAPVPAALTDGAGRAAGRRFAVYRNNVAVSLTEALVDGFPACHAVLGDETFRAMAGHFLRQHPPSSPLMVRFGEALPAYLDAAPQLSRMRWIADLARLEFAMRDSYHAADGIPLTPEELSAIPPDALGAARFALVPSARLIRSPWPVLSIRTRALDPAAPEAQPGPEDVLILRAAFDPELHLLTPGDAAFITALATGNPLADEAEAATADAAGHDPTPILTLLMQSHALTEPQP